MATKRNKRHSKTGGVKRIADEPEFREFAGMVSKGKLDPGRLKRYIDSEDLPALGDVLTINQVADLLQVSRQTVYTLINHGELKGRRVGDRWRFSKAVILKWIEGRE